MSLPQFQAVLSCFETGPADENDEYHLKCLSPIVHWSSILASAVPSESAAGIGSSSDDVLLNDDEEKIKKETQAFQELRKEKMKEFFNNHEFVDPVMEGVGCDAKIAKSILQLLDRAPP